MLRATSLAALCLALAACGPDETPPSNPVRQQIQPAREGAKDAERAMQEAADRMQAQADSAK